MRSFSRTLPALVAAAALVTALGGCGEAKVEVPESDSTYRGAVLFRDSCGGCHTIAAAGTNGSDGRDKIAGPDFDYRNETVDAALFAIRNGGFGGGLMPGNIYVGEDAKQVARFVAKWSGRKAEEEAGPAGGKQGGGSTAESVGGE